MKIGKRKIFLIIGLIVLVLAACSNVDGDLDDKWQLRQYQYADGSIERQDSIFYNFQKGSFSAICLLKNGSYQTFFGNYSLKGDKISIILLPQSMEDENYSFYMGWENGCTLSIGRPGRALLQNVTFPSASSSYGTTSSRRGRPWVANVPRVPV